MGHFQSIPGQECASRIPPSLIPPPHELNGFFQASPRENRAIPTSLQERSGPLPDPPRRGVGHSYSPRERGGPFLDILKGGVGLFQVHPLEVWAFPICPRGNMLTIPGLTLERNRTLRLHPRERWAIPRSPEERLLFLAIPRTGVAQSQIPRREEWGFLHSHTAEEWPFS